MKSLRNESGEFPSIYQLKDRAKDQPCFLMGHSKSLQGLDLERLRPFYTAGINWTLELIPASLMFYMDQQPIGLQQELIREHANHTIFLKREGRLFPEGVRHFVWGVRHWRVGAPMARPEGTGSMHYCTGTTASGALGWLYACGFDPIIMIGIDFNIPEAAAGATHVPPDGKLPINSLTSADTHASPVPAKSPAIGFNPKPEHKFFKLFDETLVVPYGRMLVNSSPYHNPEFDPVPRLPYDWVCEKLLADGHLR